jgi:hypothetical protein
MKLNYFRLRVLLMSLALGMSSVWFYNNFHFSNQNYELSQDDADNLVYLVNPNNLPEFNPIGRGCGNGYVQTYETRDGQHLSEGATSLSKIKFNNSIKNAEIIEKVPNSKNRHGELGLRVITKNVSEKGKTYFEILWFNKGLLYYISAPTLELVLKFEESDAYLY